MAKMVPYSLSPFGTGDIKTGAPTLTIASGVATLTVAQTGNIGVGCCIEFDSPTVYVYIAPNRIAFNSGGTTELKVDTKIQGNTSGATGVVRAIEVDSGSWAGGDAAGYIYFSKITGTWQSGESINRIKPTTSNNIATTTSTVQGNIGNGNTQFVVKQATGSDAANTVGAETVNSIHHEYASLVAFEAGFTDGNHIGNTALAAAVVVAYACCYYDHDDYTADTTAVTVTFGTTGANNYLQIYTPIGNSESINNQRHPGKYNANKYILSTTEALNIFCLYNIEDYIRVIGLQLKTYTTGANKYAFAIYNYNQAGVGNSAIYIGKNLLFGGPTNPNANHNSGIANSGTGARTTFIYSNIIYDWNIDTAFAACGIMQAEVTDISYIYNNTIHSCELGIENNYAGGGSANLHIKNNIVNDCTDDFNGTFNSASTHNVTDTTGAEGAFGATHATGTTTDTTANKLRDSGGGLSAAQVGSIVKNTTDTTYSYVIAVDSDIALTLNDDIFVSGENYEVYTNMYGSVTFVNEGGDDFHLAHNDTVAKNKGTDLSSDGNLPIWDDIDEEVRG